MSIQEEKFMAIANAIREKDGTTAPILANEFAARILAIQAGSGSDFAVPLIVYTAAGALITAVNGGITVSGTAGEDGTATLILTVPGEWTVTALLDGHTNAANVTVDNGYTVAIPLGSRLPAGYTELEYILSDSACGINTNYMPNLNNSRIVMDIETEAFYNGSEYIFNSDYSSISGTTYQFYMRRGSVANTISFQIGRNSGSSNFDASGLKMNIDCDCTQGKLFINGVSRLTLTRTNVTMIKPLYLLAKSAGGSTRSIRAKIYSVQIYTSGVLERDFVPCINPSGEVGLYDLVGKQFYGNALSGTFTAGPQIGPAGETTITINVSDAAGAQALVTMLTSTGSLTVAQTKITTANATVTTAESTVEISYTLAKTISKPRNVQVNGVSIGTVSSAGDKASTNIPVSESINIHFALA